MNKISKEPRRDKFKRLATKRTNEILKKIRILGNCANRQVYEFTEEDVEKIFSAIEKQTKEIKSKYKFPSHINFNL